MVGDKQEGVCLRNKENVFVRAMLSGMSNLVTGNTFISFTGVEMLLKAAISTFKNSLISSRLNCREFCELWYPNPHHDKILPICTLIKHR